MMIGGGRKRETHFVEKSGNLYSLNIRTNEYRELSVTNRGKIIYADNKKYVENFDNKYANYGFKQLFNQIIERFKNEKEREKQNKQNNKEKNRKRCPNGTRRNPTTKECEKRGRKTRKIGQRSKPISVLSSVKSPKLNLKRASGTRDKQRASIQIMKELNYRDLGIDQQDFLHDTCKVLNELKKKVIIKTSSRHKEVWNKESIIKIHNFIPFLKTSLNENDKYEGKISQQNHAPINLTYGNEKLEINDMIAKGGFGSIHRAKLSNNEIVIKQNLEIMSLNNRKSTADEIYYEHYKEAIIHNELFCMTRGKFVSDMARIPKPLFMSKYIHKTSQNQTLHIPILGMEKIQYSLHSFYDKINTDIRNKRVSSKTKYTMDKVLVYIMIHVAKLLDHLQSEYDFVHRDLHVGNVMIDMTKQTDKMKVYLIDFGYSSVIIDGMRINVEKIGVYRKYDENADENFKCHDLRMFILSLMAMKSSILYKILSLPLYKILHHLYNNITGALDRAKVPNKRAKWWRGYDEALRTVNTPLFEPKNFLCFLKNNEYTYEIAQSYGISL